VALGRTRAPEGIPALAEGLRDLTLETRLAALRGLGRMASPQAAEEILAWLGEQGLTCQTCRCKVRCYSAALSAPSCCFPMYRMQKVTCAKCLDGVLGDVATPSLGSDLLQSSAMTSMNYEPRQHGQCRSRARPRTPRP